MDYFASFVMTAIRWIASATPRKDDKRVGVIAILCGITGIVFVFVIARQSARIGVAIHK